MADGCTNSVAQTWLSSLDIPAFLNGGDFPAEMVQRVLGAKKDHITELPADDALDCAKVLFKYIGDRAQEANKDGTTLFIMIFAPITPEQDICLDFGGPEGKKAFLTMERIRAVISGAVEHENLPVIIMTPSPFTGGWACNPSLFVRPHGTTQNLVRFISKACGAAFANRIIQSYTTRGTPFVSERQRDTVQYDDMMPIRPSKEQLDSFHEFHRKIHETLEQRLSVLAGKHSFDFDTTKDNWMTYGPRKSFPLAKWEARAGGATQSHNGQDDCFSFLGEAFGGSRVSQLFHIKYLVYIELQTCPGDWHRHTTGITKPLYEGFMMTEDPDDDTVKRIFDTIEYRSSSMTLAHMLVKGLELPAPSGVKSRYWVEDDVCGSFQLAFSEVHNLFDRVALLPGETRHDFKVVRFWRPSRWLAASIAYAFAGESDQKVRDFIQQKVAPFIRMIRGTQNALLLENESVKQYGCKWIASLGLEPQTEFASTSPGHGFALENNSDGSVIPNHPDNKRKRVNTDNSDDPNVGLIASERPITKKPEVAVHGHNQARSKTFLEKPHAERTKKAVDNLNAKTITEPQDTPIADPAMPPVTKPDVKPVANPVMLPAMMPDEKLTKDPVKTAVAGAGRQTTPEFAAHPGKEVSVKSGVAKSLGDVDHKSIEECGQGLHKTDQGKSKNDSVPAADSHRSTVPAIATSDLATVDLESLLNANPAVLAQVLARALALLKLSEARAVAGSEAGGSTSGATAETTDSETAASTSKLDGGIMEDTGTVGEAPAVSKSSGETTVEHSASKVDPNKPERAVRPALINPTPPQTPTNGRGTGNSQMASGTTADHGRAGPASRARTNPQQRSSTAGQLADENEFLKAIKW